LAVDVLYCRPIEKLLLAEALALQLFSKVGFCVLGFCPLPMCCKVCGLSALSFEVCPKVEIGLHIILVLTHF